MTIKCTGACVSDKISLLSFFLINLKAMNGVAKLLLSYLNICERKIQR